MKRFLLAVCLGSLALISIDVDVISETQGQGAYLAAWTGDEDRADSDFLAIVDVDPSSPDYGRVVATVPVGEQATNPGEAPGDANVTS